MLWPQNGGLALPAHFPACCLAPPADEFSPPLPWTFWIKGFLFLGKRKPKQPAGEKEGSFRLSGFPGLGQSQWGGFLAQEGSEKRDEIGL